MKKLACFLLALLLFAAPLTARAAENPPEDTTPPATTVPATEPTKPTEPEGAGPLSEEPISGSGEFF